MYRSILKKYPVKTFNEIIGQKFVTSFLKNSLYKNIFYPLYLFAGMRGTGKTTSARLFAAASLCQELSRFQKDSGILLPCYVCDSCLAFKNKNHPDIIELDAASHTGVDTIRAIIDNAYVLPVLQEKKFYIIDEVHMLTKAAFNACLKIMEEPPEHVHFILATTELHKVIDTVRSRSITLNFKPISAEILLTYLENITKDEGISIDKESLKYIISLADYSVRDACNILERLILISDTITFEMVQQEFGYQQKDLVKDIFNALLKKDTDLYFKKKELLVGYYSQKILFEESVCYLQQLIKDSYRGENKQYDLGTLLAFLKQLYEYEQLFLTTQNAAGLFDLFLVHTQKSIKEEKINQLPLVREEVNLSPWTESPEKEERAKSLSSSVTSSLRKDQGEEEKIALFISKIGSVLSSIFKQGKIIFGQDSVVEVYFRKNFSFYKDFLQSKQTSIEEALFAVFSKKYKIVYLFKDDEYSPQNHINAQSLESKKQHGIEVQQKNTNAPVQESQHIPAKLDENSAKHTVAAVVQDKKISYNYKKKQKQTVNSEFLSPELKQIILSFPGSTYIKEE